jgi:deazaflavin-dependent oxidoreductase (nitroreductase family)
MGFNAVMIWLLRSRLHGLLDRGILLVTVTGRKSGKTYTTPVNYLRDGDTLWVTSTRGRTWWRNLKGGAPLGVYLTGHAYHAHGQAIVEESAVAESLAAYLHIAPQYAKYFKVALDAVGQPVPADCARAARERVMVRIDLA